MVQVTDRVTGLVGVSKKAAARTIVTSGVAYYFFIFPEESLTTSSTFSVIVAFSPGPPPERGGGEICIASSTETPVVIVSADDDPGAPGTVVPGPTELAVSLLLSPARFIGGRPSILMGTVPAFSWISVTSGPEPPINKREAVIPAAKTKTPTIKTSQ